MISLEEVAKRLGVSVATVRRIAERGELPSYRIGERGLYRFEPAEIDAYLASRRTGGQANEKNIYCLHSRTAAMSYSTDTKVLNVAKALEAIARDLQRPRPLGQTPEESDARLSAKLAELAQQSRGAVREAEQDY